MSAPFRLEALTGARDRTSFACGQEVLDRYFQTQVTQDIRRNIAKCFVAIEAASGHTAAYYTLAATSIPLLDLPPEQSRKLPRLSGHTGGPDRPVSRRSAVSRPRDRRGAAGRRRPPHTGRGSGGLRAGGGCEKRPGRCILSASRLSAILEPAADALPCARNSRKSPSL